MIHCLLIIALVTSSTDQSMSADNHYTTNNEWCWVHRTNPHKLIDTVVLIHVTKAKCHNSYAKSAVILMRTPSCALAKSA